MAHDDRLCEQEVYWSAVIALSSCVGPDKVLLFVCASFAASGEVFSAKFALRCFVMV